VPVSSRTACPPPDSGQAPAIEAAPGEETSTVEAVLTVAREHCGEASSDAHGIEHEKATSGEETASERVEPDGTLPLRLEENQDARDDALAIVVEDEYDDAGPLLCPLPTVHRQEYRQMFTKLRRG
jgi:hypothetical protein